MSLKDVALSSGSACTSSSLEPSYVLRALGADDEMAHSSIRFGIGNYLFIYLFQLWYHNISLTFVFPFK